MQLKFSWFQFREIWLPSCTGNSPVADCNYICNLLTDDGGCGIKHLIGWLKEARQRCSSVLSDASIVETFDSEDWSAEIGKEKTIIYSNTESLDEGQTVKTTIFLNLLNDWIDFLETTEGTDCKNTIMTINEYY
jgi:hypothetical protein